MSALRPRRAPAGPRRLSGPARAYTMLELMLVLAILALAGLLVAPRVAAWGGDGDRRAVRLTLISLVRAAQVEATARGAPVVVVFDPASRTLLAGATAKARLPDKWRVETLALRPPHTAAPDGGTRPPVAASGSGQAAGSAPLALMVWSPGGLVSASRWRVVDASGATIEIESDAIEGATIR